MPVLCMDLDDVRGVRRPSRVEAQAPGADFEFANSRSFLAQVVAQGATIAACFTCEAIAYLASEKDSEIHDFIVEFWFHTATRRLRRLFLLANSDCVPTRGHQRSSAALNVLLGFDIVRGSNEKLNVQSFVPD